MSGALTRRGNRFAGNVNHHDWDARFGELRLDFHNVSVSGH